MAVLVLRQGGGCPGWPRCRPSAAALLAADLEAVITPWLPEDRWPLCNHLLLRLQVGMAPFLMLELGTIPACEPGPAACPRSAPGVGCATCAESAALPAEVVG